MRAKVRTWVKTFMPSMAPKVEAGTKRQTIRPWPKPKGVQDIPRDGHRISCREWTGRPYHSKQRELCQGRIDDVRYVEIRRESIVFPGIEKLDGLAKQRLFAKADGFESLKDFHAWFLKDGADVFKGIFIKWEPEGKSSAAR